MPKKPVPPLDAKLIRDWPLSSAATLGSSIRKKGIFLEVRAQLPAAFKKALGLEAGAIVVKMAEGSEEAFDMVAAIVSRVLETIESLPVLPREIEDILVISSTERHRWLKDGRLPSAGTRTVKLRGRARSITFHVFDPRRIEDIQQEDLVEAWREQDAETRAENRRRAAWKTKLKRAEKTQKAPVHDDGEPRPNLVGWEEFEREGLLR